MLLENRLLAANGSLRASAATVRVALPDQAGAHAGVPRAAVPESAAELKPSWRIVSRCPACGWAGPVHGGRRLPASHYVFGGKRIELPDGGVTVAGCVRCGLHYKSVVPAPEFLALMFRRNSGSKWLEHHDYAPEIARLQVLSNTSRFDLIDIGAAGGDLLARYAGRGCAGRRSALDVMRYPGVEARLDGEFIQGFLDDPIAAWSGVPYDVATLFDVLEHLYDPATAFANLHALVRSGGLVFIETGNSDSYWPRRFGVHHWWYARLIEHHVFWCREALAAAAARHGFDVVIVREVRHKSRRELSAADAGVDLLKVGLYRIAPCNRFVLLHDHNYVPQPSMFWRSSLYEAVNGLDPGFDLAMDADLWERFSAVARIEHMPRYLSCMRCYEQQKTRSRRSQSTLEHRAIRARRGAVTCHALVERLLWLGARCARVAAKARAGGYRAQVPRAYLAWLERQALEQAAA